MKNLSDDLSIFGVGDPFKIYCYKTFQLYSIGNNRELVSFNENIVMQVQNFGPDAHLWLVYTDPEGKQYGLAVGAMLQYEREERIDIEPFVAPVS